MLGPIVRTGLLGRCPHCGQTSMFGGYYSLHETCAVCGTRYETADGAWLGALAIGYGIGALFAIAVIVLELAYHPIEATGLDPWWTIGVASLIVTAAGYRLAKGIWFSLLYRYGFMSVPGAE